jgi:hypothetical protein
MQGSVDGAGEMPIVFCTHSQCESSNYELQWYKERGVQAEEGSKGGLISTNMFLIIWLPLTSFLIIFSVCIIF